MNVAQSSAQFPARGQDGHRWRLSRFRVSSTFFWPRWSQTEAVGQMAAIIFTAEARDERQVLCCAIVSLLRRNPFLSRSMASLRLALALQVQRMHCVYDTPLALTLVVRTKVARASSGIRLRVLGVVWHVLLSAARCPAAARSSRPARLNGLRHPPR